MNKKLFKTVAAITSVLALGSAVVACNDGNTPAGPSDPVKYAVSYSLNGGVGTLPTETNKREGEKFTLASATGLTKEDYTFDGWSDGTTKYAAGAEYTMPAHAVTFTAQWKENAGGEGDVTFTVTYSLNGGVGTLPTETNKKEGEKFTLASATGLSKENYTFDSWHDGTNKYAPGAQYTMPAKNVTFTAVWKEDEETPPAPSITNIVEFEGECEVPPVHQGFMQFDGGVVVGLKLDGSTGKAYYKLQGADWVDGKWFNNNTNSMHKPDVYGSDAYYYEIKIGTVAHYVLVKSDLSKLYLCDRDDELMANGEFTMVNINNPDKPVDPDNPEQPITKYTVTYVKPSGVEGTVPAVVEVEENGKHTLLASPFTKTGWTFYKWQVNDEINLRKANTQYTITKNTTVTPVFQKTYSGEIMEYDEDKGDYVPKQYTIILADNDNAYLKGGMSDSLWGGYTRNGNRVVIDSNSMGELYLDINDTNGTFKVVTLDGLQGFEFTAKDGTTKLTFDGEGHAKLGNTDCTYTWDENAELTINLSVGGNTVSIKFEGTYPNFVINVTITVGETDYIFGDGGNIEPEEPLEGKLYDFAGEGSANAVVYGYATAEEAQAANDDLTVENKNNQSHIFYTVKVYYTPTNNKLIVNVIRKGNFSPTAGYVKLNGEDITDPEIANQVLEISNPNNYDTVFKIKFKYNQDNKRTVTITFGEQSVTWVEMTVAE
ncbi:InlB B-repeat-containing protein [Anaerocaecibacter muris]|uniref:InlB B-repeat-containing protein n=1 Tax=Anaerocaecibacter muris TaxID=2941513 RepID=UPI003F69375F